MIKINITIAKNELEKLLNDDFVAQSLDKAIARQVAGIRQDVAADMLKTSARYHLVDTWMRRDFRPNPWTKRE